MIVCRAHWLYRCIILGVSGTGKSTLYTQKILASKARWKFVFEPDVIGGFAVDAKLPIAYSEPEMRAHLKARGIVVFNSDRMFPGDRFQGFEFFCRWVFQIAQMLPGLKLFCADEIQDYTPEGQERLPKICSTLMDGSRKFRLDSIYISNQPNKIHPKLRPQLCELVVFKHFEPGVLKWIEERGIARDDVAKLRPRGHYIRRNMFTGENVFGDTHANGTATGRAKSPTNRTRARNIAAPAQR